MHSAAVPILRVDGADRRAADDRVAVEEPLEIRLDYDVPEGRRSHSVAITMRTPGDDRELAVGFLYAESVIGSAGDVAEAGHCGPPAPDSGERNVLRVSLAPGVAVALDRLERHFLTTSSCGVCGKTSLEALSLRGQQPVAGDHLRFRREALWRLPAALRRRQLVFADTGGLHAAATFDEAGELGEVREDVGRHNAVDKLLGAALLAGAMPLADRGIVVSGRASYELMQKALAARIPLLAAVGAPSSLAVALARRFNITLVGFLRDGRCNVYAGGHRIG